MNEGDYYVVERPGYFGKKREEISANFDEIYGKDNWKISWRVKNQIVERPEALQFYEDGYYEFFKSNEKVLNWITSIASDVYDTAPSNVEAGYSYDVQETPNNHIHDVAVRRAILRLGREFQGDHLVEIRGKKSEGGRLSPGLIPFHLPHLILDGEGLKDYSGKGLWWSRFGIEKSVEEFYQHNKILLVRS